MRYWGYWILTIGLLIGMLGPVAAQHVAGQEAPTPLIRNGGFEQGLDFWTINQPCTSCSMRVEGSSPQDRRLEWQRTNANGSGSAIWAVQQINRDVSGARTLTLTFTARVDQHNLTNSGWWSDQHGGSGEYPVKVTLNFTDAAGTPFEWSVGLLVVNDGSTMLRNNILVQAGQWTPFEANLLDVDHWLDARGAALPAPATLVNVVVGGSGWDFAAGLDDIQLTLGQSTGEGQTSGAGSSGEQTASGFIVEEYPLVAADQDSPTHFEFRQYVTDQILDVRRAWREPELDSTLIAANQVIGSAGYMFIPNYDDAHTYTLYRGDSLLFADVSHLYPVAVSEAGDFRLLFDAWSNPGTLIMTPDTIGQVDMAGFIQIAPVYVGNDLVEVWADWEHGQFQVRRAGEVVYTVVPDGPFVEPPVKSLWSWNGQWLIESEGRVILDGTDLTAQMGLDEMFGWRILHGEPFYFFAPAASSPGGRIAMSYAGQEVVPYVYDEVVHYQCCEPSMFNLSGNETMVWFYGLRDGMWYYVEAGVYD